MKFVIAVACVACAGVALGLAIPMSAPADGGASPTNPAPDAAQEAGQHLFDYSRVVHAYREDVDGALRSNLRATVRAAEQKPGGDRYEMSTGADGTVRLLRATPEGGRIRIEFRVRSAGDDAEVNARVFVDMLPEGGALGHVPTAITSRMDWSKFAPTDVIRADIDNFVSGLEARAKRRRAGMEAERQYWDARSQAEKQPL